MRILYLNHVCWEWIFQRPQILALQLEKDFECTVLNKMFILGRTVAHDNVEPKERKNVWLLPKGQKYKIINSINNLLYRMKVKRIARNFDLIWACHPSVYDGIPKDYNGLIVYDCMDNHVALTFESNRKRLKKLEDALIKRADLILVSSMKLKEVIPGLENAILVRNGFISDVIPHPIKTAEIKRRYKIGYFGTISSWFDFKTLENSLEYNSKIEYHVIGPLSMDVGGINNDKIIFEGMVEHKKLGEKIDDYDALIMPFIVNDIILSVDPVKLYEYINFGKCVISVWYPEIDRFEPFVYFYKDAEEYNSLMGELSARGFPPKYNERQREEFLKNNSWEARYRVIKENLLELIHGKQI